MSKRFVPGRTRRGGRSFLSGPGLLGLAVLGLTATSAAAQDVERMDAVIRDAVARGEFSGAILVARGDQVLLDRGYGLANREWNAPNDGTVKFRLASVSKQFTAAAVLILNERGLVDLDAPVKTWLPDAPAAWDGVTIRRLLNHASGVPDYTRFDDYQALKALPTTPQALIARFRDRPLDFAPGEGWAYSNSGYVLLTAVIEKASGRSYADFVAETLFRPLGMVDSGYDDPAVVTPRRASGYTPEGQGARNADYVDMTVPQGAGGLYSTTHDLLKWEQALFGGRVLAPASLAAMITPDRRNYALGVEVRRVENAVVVSHSGGIEGFNTYMSRETLSGLTVIVLGNLNGPGPDRLGPDLMTLARGGNVTLAHERRAISVPTEALRAYEGVYELAPGVALTVAVADGVLTAQASGQKPAALSAEGDDAFFLAAVDARIVFGRDASGAVDVLVLRQNGREMRAKRLE